MLWAPLTWAQLKTERTIIQKIETQKPDEAKKSLLHSAVLEGIEQYSTEIGIDPVVFRNKLNEKFNIHFEEWKTRQLKEKFGKNYATELSPEQKKTFLDGLDNHKEKELLKFARLERLVDSYAFTSFSHGADGWAGTIILNLNRGKIEKFYKRLLSDQNKHYSKLIILPEINLIGISWPDLGLDKASLFTDPLMNSWSKWLTKNQPSNVEDIVKCTSDCLDDFREWLQIPQEEDMQVQDSIHHALWVKILYNVRKISFIPDINEWEFEWDGSIVLLDANTKLLLSSQNIKTRKKIWRGLDQKALNSALASAMYKSALGGLQKISKKVEDSSRFNRLSRLVITGHKNLGDVMSLIELLRKEGNKLYLELKLDFFKPNEAHLLCFYQGEEKSFTDLLSGVKELKSSHSYSLVNEFTGVNHVLKLIAE